MIYLCPEKFCLPTTSRKSSAGEYFLLIVGKQANMSSYHLLTLMERNYLEYLNNKSWKFQLQCKSEMIFWSRVRWAESLVWVTSPWPTSRVLVQVGSRTTRSCWAKHLHSSGVWWHNSCSPSTSAINLGSGCLWSKLSKSGLIAASAVTEVRQPKWNKQIFAKWTCSVPNVRCF